ncbi:hypothetical protein Dda_2597 [Drechslerella dactyloides]|uniref:rRNA adenine N(6)-methyltransferase n=1 Tax=Drechslerella dactyloides TaxID=74499 RepID=A0AAD6IZU1_DREDA|nr:hypothetical protein Dda_2597 [Drechslerella dactyloides]
MLQAQAALQLNRFTNVRSRALHFHQLQILRYPPQSQMRAATTIVRRIVADTVAPQRPIARRPIALCTPRTLATAAQIPKKRGRPPKATIDEDDKAPKTRGRPKKVTAEETPKPRGRPRKVDAEDAKTLYKAIVKDPNAAGEEVERETTPRRGRPKKVAVEEEVEEDVPKPRGRPRKAALIEEVEEEPEATTSATTKRRTKTTATKSKSKPVEVSDEETRGRPRLPGPPLPVQIVVVDGIEKVIKFRPGRDVGFRSQDMGVAERPEGTVDYASSTAAMRSSKQHHGRPPAAPGPLTLLAMKYLKTTTPKSKELQRQLKQNGWYSRAMNTREPEEDVEDQEDTKAEEGSRGRENSDSDQQWPGAKDDSAAVSEKWRSLTRKAVRGISPLLEKLIQAKTPSPKNSAKPCVISESQCERIFKTFDFSEYQGCQIIDFNPGFGIYSRALNKAVKPSRHLLFEPEAAFHPLLSKTCNDPSFQLMQKDLYFWKTFDDLVSEGTITPKKMSREDGLNTSILVTGMLLKDVKGDRFMAQIIDAIGNQDWVFRYGRVKLLMWVDTEVASRYIPRSFGRRNRPAVLAEAFTDIREIAQPTPVYNWADLRFLNRMDRWREPGHLPNSQDQLTGVAYANQLTYVKMVRKPEALILDTMDYWPQLPWAESTLLDFTPKVPESDYLRGLVPDTEPWKFFNFFLTTAFMSRHNTVREVLAKIGGGTEKMLEMDPELAAMPGLAEKHAVHTSVDELAKLARAYEFWPWRAPDYLIGQELRLRSFGMMDEDEHRF